MTEHPRPSQAGIGVGRTESPPSALTQQVAWLLFAGLLVVALLALAVGPSNDLTDGRAADADGATAGAVDGDAAPPTTAVGSAQFTLAVSGDIIVHESVAESARTDQGFDFGPQFAPVADVLQAADIAVCHLEVPLSSTNTDLEYYPAFRVPNQLADAIAGAGFDACSTASNHSLDAGPAGVASTLDQLDRAGVAHAGTARSASEATSPLLLDTASGVTVGWLSYSYGFNGTEVPSDQSWLANTIDPDRIERDAAAARAAGAGFVVVSMHWGDEYQIAPNALQQELASSLLASPDIDLLVGHHAHVVQTVQRFDDEYAILGLGNFLSNQSPITCSSCPIGTEDGAILTISVTQAPDGSTAVDSIELTPTWVDRTNGHRIVDASSTEADVDPAILTASADRTRAALGPEVS